MKLHTEDGRGPQVQGNGKYVVCERSGGSWTKSKERFIGTLHELVDELKRHPDLSTRMEGLDGKPKSGNAFTARKLFLDGDLLHP